MVVRAALDDANVASGLSTLGRSGLKVTVKLFASLGQYLPSGAIRNQIEMEFPEGTTPADVVERLNVPRDLAHLVIVNGVFVPPSERTTRALAEHEELAIFPPVAGG